MNKISSKLVKSVRKAKETQGDETQKDETEVSNNTSLARSTRSEKKSPPSSPSPSPSPSPSKPTPSKKIVDDEVPLPKIISHHVWPD